MKIAIYTRKSKLTQKGESIQNQIDMCKNYALTHFNVDENDIFIYEDEGYSGGNADRPEYKRLLRDISKGKINILMCYRLDRISRNVLDFSNVLDILNKHNTSFVSITETFDTTTPMGRAMVNIAAVFAQLERETIAERIRDNMRSLARTGRYIGSTPAMGFKAERMEYTDNNGNKKSMQRLIPVPEELRFIETVYEKYIEFDSLSKVETWLMQNRMFNHKGNAIGTTELRRLLTNPVYVKADEKIYEYFTEIGTEVINSREEFTDNHGMLLYGKHDRNSGTYDPTKWMVVLAKHQGVIDSAKWIAVQRALEINKSRAPRAGTSKYGLLTSKIRCAECGGTMVLIFGNTRDRHYYKCRNKIKSRKSICNIKNITGREADDEIYNYLIMLSDDNEKMRQAVNKTKPNREYDIEVIRYEELKLRKEIKDKEFEIKNLTAQLRDNKSSVAAKYIIEEIEKVDSEISNLNQLLKALNQKKDIAENIEESENKITREIRFFAKNASTMTFDEKRSAVDKIIDKIIWNGREFTVFFK